MIAFLLLSSLFPASNTVLADYPQADLLAASAAPGLSSAEELMVCDLMRAITKGIGLASPVEASKAEAEQSAMDRSLVWKTAPRDLRCSNNRSRLRLLKGDRVIERVGTSSDGESVALSWSGEFHGGTYYFRKVDMQWRLASETFDWEFWGALPWCNLVRNDQAQAGARLSTVG